MHFHQKLQSERARLGLTQEQAASLLDVSSRVYWDWEKNKTAPAKIAQEGAILRLASAKISKQPKK